MFSVRIDQRKDQPITLVQGEKINFRYTFYRSSDTQKENDIGQDYIAINADNNQIAFCLCDGVSQSFYGDLAAKMIGNELVDWLWINSEKADSNNDLFHQQLCDFISSISLKSNQLTESFSLPEDISPMLKVVLEKKRLLGSESMFVAGFINALSNYALFAWIGDCRLRAWEIGNEKIEINFGKNTFQTKERWSSKKEFIGNLHTKIIKFEKPFRVIAYSDGLSRMDKKFEQGSPSNKTLEKIILESSQLPSSDDISFVEIHINNEDENKPNACNISPKNVRVNYDKEKKILLISWSKVDRASSYDIAVKTDSSLSMFSTENIVWEVSTNKLPNLPSTIKVRAWINQEVTDWSPEITLGKIVFDQTITNFADQPTIHSILINEISDDKEKVKKIENFKFFRKNPRISFLRFFTPVFTNKKKKLLIFFLIFIFIVVNGVLIFWNANNIKILLDHFF